MVNVSSFISLYNQALRGKHRMFRVYCSASNYDLVLFLYHTGYVLGYHVSGNFITVFPNYASGLIKRIKLISTPSRPICYSFSKLSKDLKSGKNYIVYSQSCFSDSKISIINNLGGLVVGLFYLFLKFKKKCFIH